MRSMALYARKLRASLGARLGMRGESLVETLAALLICSLAVLMLYTALTSAARMNNQADQNSQLLRDDLFAAEMQGARDGAAQESGQVRFSGYEEAYDVTIYTGSTGTYKSYSLD